MPDAEFEGILKRAAEQGSAIAEMLSVCAVLVDQARECL
jgi:hypothetical protein